MRDHIIGFIIAVLFACALLFGVWLIRPQPVEATSAMYDQWVPVTRSISMSNADRSTFFTWSGPITFLGVGLSDLTIDGDSYTGHREGHYIIVVEDDSVNPELFMWSDDGGHTWTTGVAFNVAPVTLSEGVTVAAAAVIGHTNGESWHWTQHTVGHSDIAVAVITGAGLDDLTTSGTYRGQMERPYRVEVTDAVASPDEFRWAEDGGVTWVESDVGMLVAAYHLSEGVASTFAAQDGHTLGDYWDFLATPASQQLIIGSINWTCTAVKAASHVQVMDSEDNNQFDIFSYVALGNGEVIYDPPVRLPIGLDLKMDTNCADTGIIYFNVNAWLRDVNY